MSNIAYFPPRPRAAMTQLFDSMFRSFCNAEEALINEKYTDFQKFSDQISQMDPGPVSEPDRRLLNFIKLNLIERLIEQQHMAILARAIASQAKESVAP